MINILLNTAYFPPVEYLLRIKEADSVIIEQWETFGKQSYRNRCEIMTANGILTLTVPVVKASTKKTLTRDVRIDYDERWQAHHLRSVASAYRNAPYYEEYIEMILPFWEKHYNFLIDLNTDILSAFLEILHIKKEIRLSADWIEIGEKKGEDDIIDLRDTIDPKQSRRRPLPAGIDPLSFKTYYQLFSERFSFSPNLSCLDLLFCNGAL